MRDIIHLMIIILMIPWVMMILGSVFRQSKRACRSWGDWEEKRGEMNSLREEHRQFRDQVLEELRGNREATEKQNEILNRILERMGGQTTETLEMEEPSSPTV